MCLFNVSSPYLAVDWDWQVDQFKTQFANLKGEYQGFAKIERREGKGRVNVEEGMLCVCSRVYAAPTKS